MKLSIRIFPIFLFLFQNYFSQNPTFKVTEKNFASTPVPDGATYFFNTTPKSTNEFTLSVKNISTSNLTLSVRKTEIKINTVSPTDKGDASFCFGTNCHTSDVFVDTFVIATGYDTELGTKFIEASIAGNSKVSYQIINLGDKKETFTFYINYTGVVSLRENYINESTISIFPQPCDKVFSIDLKKTDSMDLSIYDLQGNKMENIVTENNKGILSARTEKLPVGIYIMKISVDGTIFTKKLVVSH